MRFAVRFALAVVAACLLGIVLPATLQAQFRRDPQLSRFKPSLEKPEPAGAVTQNYQVTQTTGAIVPGTAQVTGFADLDDGTAPITLPFVYTLYDQAFTTANVSTNGNIQFVSNNNDYGQGEVCLPLAQFNYVILPHWGDLTIGGANEGVFTSVTGVAPNRIFNIEWRTSLLGNTAGSLNFEIRLYEGQTRFDFVYGTAPGGGSEVTVGVQRAVGSTFTEFSCHQNSLRNGTELIFQDSGAGTLFIAGRVTDSGGNPIAGVTVNLSGTSSGTVVTDGTGTYSFPGLVSGGSYTVAATQPGFSFFPASKTFGPGGRVFNGNFIVNFIRTTPPNPGDILISEFRFRGQTFGASDEFVELVNNTDQGITVNVTDGSTGWLLQSSRQVGGGSAPSIIVPNGTTIPARGHYLAGNGSGYSLGSYASADTFFALGADIPDDGGVALFNTADAASLDAVHQLDAVGFTGESDALYREGAGLASPGANNGNYSFVRKLLTGRAQDTNNNANDFVFVATDGGSYGGVQSTLGAPAPESTASPIQRNAQIKSALIDPQQASTVAPNRVRDLTAVTNGALGTLVIRRKFSNQTGVFITRLRFRIVDITTKPAPAGTADLRALNSTSGSVTITGGGSVQVIGLTLEQAPDGFGGFQLAQPQGGGLNSSLGVGVITVAQPLAPGAPVNVEFKLGVQQGGSYRFFVNVEALP